MLRSASDSRAASGETTEPRCPVCGRRSLRLLVGDWWFCRWCGRPQGPARAARRAG
jgi:hypothetical protein